VVATQRPERVLAVLVSIRSDFARELARSGAGPKPHERSELAEVAGDLVPGWQLLRRNALHGRGELMNSSPRVGDGVGVVRIRDRRIGGHRYQHRPLIEDEGGLHILDVRRVNTSVFPSPSSTTKRTRRRRSAEARCRRASPPSVAAASRSSTPGSRPSAFRDVQGVPVPVLGRAR
jgi:hypothetical protein